MNHDDPKYAALHAKYPSAYPLPDRSRSPWSFDQFGFQCGPGWLGILDELGPVLELHGAHVHQVKEKLGGLRVYASPAPAEVDDAIDVARAKASLTCEQCGFFGSCSSIFGWLKTYCPACRWSELSRVAAVRGLRCSHVANGARGQVLVQVSLEPEPAPAGLPPSIALTKSAIVCELCAPAVLQAAGLAAGLRWP